MHWSFGKYGFKKLCSSEHWHIHICWYYHWSDQKSLSTGDFPGGPGVKTPLPLQGVWAETLSQGKTPHTVLHNMAKKILTNTKQNKEVFEKLSSSWRQIKVFQNSKFCSKAWILSLSRNSLQIPPVKQAHFVHFLENVR